MAYALGYIFVLVIIEAEEDVTQSVSHILGVELLRIGHDAAEVVAQEGLLAAPRGNSQTIAQGD